MINDDEFVINSNILHGVRKNAPGKKAPRENCPPWKYAPKENCPPENCLPEKCPPGKLPPGKLSPEKLFYLIFVAFNIILQLLIFKLVSEEYLGPLQYL